MTFTRWLLLGGIFSVVIALCVAVFALLGASGDMASAHQDEHQWDR